MWVSIDAIAKRLNTKLIFVPNQLLSCVYLGADTFYFLISITPGVVMKCINL